MKALEVVGITDLGNFLKLHLALRNLDHRSRRAFEEQCSSFIVHLYSDFSNFIAVRNRKLSLLTIGDADAMKSDIINDSPVLLNDQMDNAGISVQLNFDCLKNGININKVCLYDKNVEYEDDEEGDNVDDGNNNEDVDTIAMDDQEDSLELQVVSPGVLLNPDDYVEFCKTLHILNAYNTYVLRFAVF
ncbi:hypothetical protein FQA39_LY13462 [Lamprigera yunnana]|nr:hypothetical protein FQA39_LY13462 [Lamprigera yunnana]